MKKKFPDKKGYIYLWLPGYNAARTKAVIYGYFNDSISASGHIFYMEKKDNKWVLVEEKTAWIT